jgi:hypothetical protein
MESLESKWNLLSSMVSSLHVVLRGINKFNASRNCCVLAFLSKWGMKSRLLHHDDTHDFLLKTFTSTSL